MTVAELIAVLQGMPQNLLVVIPAPDGHSYGACLADSVKLAASPDGDEFGSHGATESVYDEDTKPSSEFGHFTVTKENATAVIIDSDWRP